MSTSNLSTDSAPRGIHGGVSGWFRASCWEASKGGSSSSSGYFFVGSKLAGSLGHEAPWDIEDEEWYGEIDRLQEMLGDAEVSDERVWGWFQQHYPKFVELIPARRREQFLAGVRHAHDEGEIEI